jgi:hypothetical protein
VDDTGIEPVTPTMSILAYAVLRVSGVLTSNAFTLNWNLKEPLGISSSLQGVRQVLGKMKIRGKIKKDLSVTKALTCDFLLPDLDSNQEPVD